MPRKPAAKAPHAAFGALLDAHLRAGQRPDTNNREPWTDTAFAKLISGRDADSTGSSPRRVANWRRGTVLPSAIEPILWAFFGPLRTDGGAARETLRDAYNKARLREDQRIIEAAPHEADALDFVVDGPRLAIKAGAADDAKAAGDPAVARRHATVTEKLHDLVDIVGMRLDNQSAWRLVRRTAERALSAAEQPTPNLPDVLVDLYDHTVSLGTYISQDDAIGSIPAASDAPLDPDVRRAMVDYLSTAAPWLRTFPSVLAWDSARRDFLTRPELYEPTRAVLHDASKFLELSAETAALSPQDAARAIAPLEAAERPGVLGEKAGYRGVATARRLLYAASAVVAGFLSGAVASDYATRSVLIKNLGALLEKGEAHALRLVAGDPDDLRAALANVAAQNAALKEEHKKQNKPPIYADQKREVEQPPITGTLHVTLEDATVEATGVLSDASLLLRPPWASGFGRDQYGTYADFTLPGTDISQRLRWVPPGCFSMGSPESANEDVRRLAYEGPQHEVIFAEGYWLFDTPCTQALWQGVISSNPSRFVNPLRPVEQVDFTMVQDFIARLNERIPGLELSLPSEAEFERAARAGTATATWAGDLEIKGYNNAPILHPIAWYGGNSGLGYDLDDGENSSSWPQKQFEHRKAGTRQVKTRAANPWGFYDLLGNVWEWCADTWHHNYEGATTDGSAWIKEGTDARFRIVRGGSWRDVSRFVRAAWREGVQADDRNSHLGFRCARVQVPGEAERRAGPRMWFAMNARNLSAGSVLSGEAVSSSSPRPKGAKS